MQMAQRDVGTQQRGLSHSHFECTEYALYRVGITDINVFLPPLFSGQAFVLGQSPQSRAREVDSTLLTECQGLLSR